ncbi:MAG: efflux RND transporter periplasmic adaptor subunit [Aquabacterium sp.]
MTSSKKWIALAAGLLVLSVGIGRAIMGRKAQQAALSQSTASAQAGVVALMDKDVYTVRTLPLTRSLPVSGSLTAQRSAIVKAKVSAELLSLNVREGDQVKADQVIGKLDAQEFDSRLKQAHQQAASAKAQWQIAQQNLDNNQLLVKQGFISRNALDTSVSNADAAKATYEAAKAAEELAGKALRDSVIRVPIGGLISQRYVQVGERVSIDGRIVEVVDLSSLELQAPLSPQDVVQVQIGTPASLHIDGIEAPVQARIARINPSASADTRSVMVYLSLPKHAGLRQGLFVQGRITLDRIDTLAIPQSAISRDAGLDQVLLVSGDKVRKVGVKLGPRAGLSPDGQAMAEVLEGIQPGDRILVNGAGTVREGQAVRLSQSQAQTPVQAPAASAAH